MNDCRQQSKILPGKKMTKVLLNWKVLLRIVIRMNLIKILRTHRYFQQFQSVNVNFDFLARGIAEIVQYYIIFSSDFYWKLQIKPKEGRKLVRKGFFGVGKWKKDRISMLKTFLTKAISQYTFKMHLKAIQKSNNKVI